MCHSTLSLAILPLSSKRSKMAEKWFSLPGKRVAVDVKNASNGEGTSLVQTITNSDGTVHVLLVCGCKDPETGQWYEVIKHCKPTHDVVCDCTNPKKPRAFCALT
jgi:hypothetical protein